MHERLSAMVRSIALVGARRPFMALAIGLILTAIGTALIPGLKISTSRRDLVSEDNPNQKQSVEFDSKFGYSNAPAIVVSGGTPDEQRSAVDAIERELEAMPELEGRVLGRIQPQDVAEVMFVADPEAVAKQLGEGQGAKGEQLERGIVGWVGLVDDKLKAGLEGDTATPEQTKEGFAQLSTLFSVFDDELAGKNGLLRLGTAGADKGGADKAGGDKGGADKGSPLAATSRGFDEAGYLVGDEKHHIVALFPVIEGDEGYQVRPMVKQLRAARDRALGEQPAVRADVTGLPALVTDELATIERDLAVTSTASTIALFLTLFWAFKSFRQSLVSFLPLGFGTLVTFGIVRLVLGKLNLVTASFTSVLLGLGDFGVHIQTRYSELLRRGHDPKEAMQTAMLRAGPGLLVGTITTAVAFLTTIVTEFTAFAELGFITSLGLIVMLAGTYLLVPSAVLILLGKKPRPSPELPGFRPLAGVIKRNAKTIVALSVISSVLFCVFVPKLSFNGRYFEFLPRDTESARGLEELQKDAVVSPFVANVRASSLDEARTVATKLRALGSVASVETPSDMFPELTPARVDSLKKIVAALEHEGKPLDFAAGKDKPVDRAALLKALDGLKDTMEEAAYTLRQAGRDTTPVDDAKAKLSALIERVRGADQARLDALQSRAFDMLDRALATARRVVARGAYAPEDLPPLFKHRFVSKDGSEVALFVHPHGDIWEIPVAEQFNRDLATVTSKASGIATTLADHPKMIVRGFERATILAVLLVIVILVVSFRRLSDVLVAAIPLLLGTAWMLGAMPPLGLQFNHANMVVLPLLLGLGVDAGAHIMTRYRQSAEEHGGVAHLGDMLASTGSAVFVASLTTVWGFSVMMFGKYRAMFGMGLIMTIGMSATLAFTLLTLPAVLVLLKRAK